MKIGERAFQAEGPDRHILQKSPEAGKAVCSQKRAKSVKKNVHGACGHVAVNEGDRGGGWIIRDLAGRVKVCCKTDGNCWRVWSRALT